MSRYKLIKKYPGSPEIGTIAKEDKIDFIYYYINGNSYTGIGASIIENNPEFWEKVVEKDYEILSFISKLNGTISTKKENGKFSSQKFLGHYNESIYLSSNDYNIHSVKRLSDSEIFTVGDKIDCNGWFGSIVKFKIVNDELKIFQQQHVNSSKYNPLSIKDLIKFKQPLFKTEDGVDIFEGSHWFYIFKDWSGEIYKTNKRYCAEGEIDLFKSAYNFSTKEAAEEYVLFNKPCLSIKEIAPIFGMYHLDNSKTSLDRLSDKLKELVKSKI